MPKRSPLTFWQALEHYPPVYVRLLAKKGTLGRAIYALTDAELAIMTGMTIERIREISRMLTWDEVTLGECRSFCDAARFDPTVGSFRKRVYNYRARCQKLNQIPFHYLRVSPKWESEFLPLIRLLSSHPSHSTAFPGASSPAKRLSA